MDAETAWIEDRCEGAAATIKKFANDWGLKQAHDFFLAVHDSSEHLKGT